MTVETKEADTEQNLLATEQSVVMQTAMTTVSDSLDTVEELVRLLMDCGSARSYMAEALSKRLHLKPGKVTEISLFTFGSEKPKIV